MPNNDYILRSDALKAILGVSIYDTIEELDGARTIAENTWADGLYDAYKIIEEEVDAADVEPKQRWIPVTERLPKKNDEVIVICYDDHPECCTIGCSLTGEMQWWGEEQWYQTKHIKYWMPLPDPPKGEDDD